MLRVMKEKARSSDSESSSRQSGADSPLDEMSGQNENDKTPVISNVPNSISVPTEALPTSTSSSISSDGLHILAPLSRVSEDETTDSFRVHVTATDSHRESSQQDGQTMLPTEGSTSHKRPNDQTFARKVSATDSEGNQDNMDASTDSKRRKLSLEVPTAPHVPSVRLLAMPEDSTALNSLHAFCRMQIEVFTATPIDMAQPAPGRKTPIKLHQVGLRCIHCRHLTSRERVKRAVCYPRSVSRIYHSVSDMKFDHFSHCSALSPELRAKFQSLKEECKRRGGADRKDGSNAPVSSTAQYYHDAACKMGLVDSQDNDGIFMAGQVLDHTQLPPSVLVNAAVQSKPPAKLSGPTPPGNEASSANGILSSHGKKQIPFSQGFPVVNAQVLALYHNMQGTNGLLPNDLKLQMPLMQSASTSAFTATNKPTASPTASAGTPSTDNLCLLAMPDDSTALNGLHCFVRRNVEVFIATKEDAAAPSPGRRTRVKVGQVGLRCIHCARLPIKERVKRAVCYPPSVSGIYHSISNMKFDHFGNCKGLSPEARAEFANLRKSSSRRNSPSSSGGRSSSSTAQYYEESAARLGLIDTQGGIQFRYQDGSGVAPGDSATDGISALMIAATNPTVRADFDRRRAETVATSVKVLASV